MVGYLGYDVVREIERLPDVPPDDLGMPDAVLSLTGHVTAFDHFRQRLYLIENVFLDAAGGDARRVRRLRRAPCARLDARVDELARPLPYVPSPPPADELTELPAVHVDHAGRRVPRGGGGGARVHPRRRHLPGRAGPALRPRRPLDPFDVYRVLRQVNPSPYMYFVRHPEATLVGSSPEPMVQLLDGRVISRPIAGRAGAAAPRSTTGGWPPS